MPRHDTLAKALLMPADTLKLTCGRCRFVLTLTREQAFRVFGQDATPYLVTRDLRCRKCNSNIIHASV